MLVNGFPIENNIGIAEIESHLDWKTVNYLKQVSDIIHGPVLMNKSETHYKGDREQFCHRS